MCACQMLEDHKWGHQIFHFLLLAGFCCTFTPSSDGCQKNFLRKSDSAGQLLSLRITGFANPDEERIQDLSCKYLHRYNIVTALKSEGGNGIWNRRFLCSERPGKKRKRTTLIASPGFATRDLVASVVFSERSWSEAWWHQWIKSLWY